MINKAYEELTKKYNDMQERLRFFKDKLKEEVSNSINELWIEYEPRQVKKSFLAIDGGEFAKETRYGTIYITNAEIILSKGLEENEGIDGEVRVGVLSPGNLGKERVSEIMSILELSLALKHGDEGDIILMDGSLLKKIGKGKDVTGEENPNLDEVINTKDEQQSYNQLVLNKQIVLSKLIQKYGDKTLWISKNSKGREIFNQEISDIAVLETLTENPGYTRPNTRYIKLEDLAKNNEVQVLAGMEYTSFLMRLEKGQKVLKVDMIGRLGDEEIREIMDSLSLVSINGYPYPLLKVHFDVKVSRDDRNRILTLFNLKRKRGNSWWPIQFY